MPVPIGNSFDPLLSAIQMLDGRLAKIGLRQADLRVSPEIESGKMFYVKAVYNSGDDNSYMSFLFSVQMDDVDEGDDFEYTPPAREVEELRVSMSVIEAIPLDIPSFYYGSRYLRAGGSAEEQILDGVKQCVSNALSVARTSLEYMHQRHSVGGSLSPEAVRSHGRVLHAQVTKLKKLLAVL